MENQFEIIRIQNRKEIKEIFGLIKMRLFLSNLNPEDFEEIKIKKIH